MIAYPRHARRFGYALGTATLATIALIAACSDDGTAANPNKPGDDAGTAKPDTSAPDGSTANPLCASDVTTAGKAKNVIFFLGDGMGISVLTAARIYKVGEEGELQIDKLPETGFVRTYSNNYMVTDSAPSMSAYMTGVKMNNNVISMSPETISEQAKCVGTSGYKADAGVAQQNGTAVTTFLELAKKAGKGTGIVTPTNLTDATPAATYAHICQRGLEYDIAAQLVPGGAGYNPALGAGVDVVLGGGSDMFDPARRTTEGLKDGRDLFKEFAQQNYTVVRKAAELAAYDANSGKRLFGSFATGNMEYEVDRATKAPDQPSLTEMALKALDVVSKNPKGYFLMVEGGRIDHALHATNARRALEETVAFDSTIEAILKKVDLSNTLVVVTADHDHTLVQNGYARRVGKTTDSNPGILGLVRKVEPNGADIYESDQDNATYTILGFGNGPNRKAKREKLDEAVAAGRDYKQEATFALGQETHGGTDVSIWAAGASAEQVHGFMTNTEVFNLLRCGAGL
ncbi:alkaline phosphatase [Pendulispora albinea]|uniref:Alkaline phosphatase n=1 Tax=Pendulispora albinea TaxID=2741071 RepID=A0ABZ2LTG6_9BACT